ncbi:ATP-binding cassette domain-containing protein (plasmid) [Cereibacter azotoformans]|uniref:ABC transporter ATP-binding protein n=1 Tax=Cereibacter azotoformans TaxID=43057 RepID=UPI001EEA8068|nr:ATP-binding cassette domain-containing protein [Cereibacter azotoformans]ULB12420.1 ATP-binding cassette domain-containing protein [Cereibacter azotoformans]
MLDMERVGHAFLGRTVLSRVELTVERAEVVALVGPSGSGKSTLVHIAAGLIEPAEGRVTRNWRRQAMVFQEPRLLPWATALDNIAYPLRIAGQSRRAARAAAEDAAARVALDPADLGKYPVELSGGMRQRTAIARALVAAPDFIHFDEPFTALDVALRRRMQDLVIAAAATGDFAALFVTHDLAEAARIAHRVAVLDASGRGILGARRVPGTPGARTEAEIFALVQGWLTADPLFRRIHDIDERRAS